MLILDEPTNHLDIESREALEDALRAFTGALLLVSHDRALLDAVGTRTVAVEERSLRSYIGGWPEYVRVRDERRGEMGSDAPRVACARLGTACALPERRMRAPGALRRTHRSACGSALRGACAGWNAARNGATKRRSKPKPAGTLQEPPHARRQTAERAVEQAEAAMRELEDQLADPAAWATQYESAKSEARHTAARRAVEEAYARLEALVE